MKQPNDWPLVGYLAFLTLALVLYPLWSSIHEEWLRSAISGLGIPMEPVSRNVPSLLAAGVIVIGIYRYLKKQFEEQLADIVQPRINLGATKEHLEFLLEGGTLDQQLLEVRNVGKGHLQNCRVTIDEVIWDDGSKLEPYVTLATTARAREGKVGRFNLDAGSPKQLLLTSRDLSDPRNPDVHTLMGENYPIP